MSSSTRSPIKPPTDHPTSSLRHTLTEDFDKMNSAKGTPGHLDSIHDLVLDYLHQNAYASTAKILSQPRPRRSSASTLHVPPTETPTPRATDDTAMEIDGSIQPSAAESSHEAAKRKAKERVYTSDELNSIERRRVIINHILNGAIMRAVENINSFFPDVLDETKASNTEVWNEIHLNIDKSDLPQFTPTHRPPHSSVFSQPPKPMLVGYSAAHDYPVYCESCHPAHVKLNLQIQQFIESFRNLAPSSPSSPSSSISSLTSSMHMSVTLPPSNGTNGSTSNGIGSLNHGSSSNGFNHSSSSSGVTLTNALTAAQGLHAEAKKLPAHVRAVYLQEIKDVGALFAYTEPEKSILSGFLEQTRRIYLADQVNSAILLSEGRPGPSFLLNIAQRTQALYAICKDRRIDVIPTDLDDRSRHQDITAAYWRYQQQSVHKSMTGFTLKQYVRDNWA